VRRHLNEEGDGLKGVTTLRTSEQELVAVGNKMSNKIRRSMGTRCDNGGCNMNRGKNNNYNF
jgi:hypothetical protein